MIKTAIIATLCFLTVTVFGQLRPNPFTTNSTPGASNYAAKVTGNVLLASPILNNPTSTNPVATSVLTPLANDGGTAIQTNTIFWAGNGGPETNVGYILTGTVGPILQSLNSPVFRGDAFGYGFFGLDDLDGAAPPPRLGGLPLLILDGYGDAWIGDNLIAANNQFAVIGDEPDTPSVHLTNANNGFIIIDTPLSNGLTVIGTVSATAFAGNGSGVTNTPVSFATANGLIQTNPAPGWSKRLLLSVNSIDCGSTSNQNIFVNLVTNQMNTALMNAHGYDIQVYDSDGLTAIPYFRSQFTQTNVQLIVQLPYFAGTGQHPIAIDYGNSSITTDQFSTNGIIMPTPTIPLQTGANWWFNEGTGTNIFDHSDSISNALLNIKGTNWQWATGGPFTNGANPNGTFLWVGTNTYLVTSNQFALPQSGGYDLTWEGWVKWTNVLTSGQVDLIQKIWNGGSDYDEINVRFQVGVGQLACPTYNGQTYLSTFVVDTNWHHYAMSLGYDSGTFYVDGKMVLNLPGYGRNGYTFPGPKPLTFNLDTRFSTPTTNTVGWVAYGPWSVTYTKFTPSEVNYLYNLAGRAPLTREVEKWQRQKQFPSSIPSPRGFYFSESTRFVSSYDNQWTMMHTGGNNSGITGGEQAVIALAKGLTRDSGWYYQSNVVGNGVGGLVAGNYAPHGFAVDDGNGACYWFWSTNNFPNNLWYVTSTNGGRNFANPTVIPINGLMLDNNTGAGNNEGNVSVTKVTEGPLAGKYVYGVDNQLIPSHYQWWLFTADTITGSNLCAVNGGHPVAFWLANAANVVTNTLNDIGPLEWDGEHYYLHGQIDAINKSVTRVATAMCVGDQTKLNNWVLIEGGGLEIGDLDIANPTVVQIGDNRSILSDGGSCSMSYGVNIGNNLFTNRFVTFNGTFSQLVHRGSYYVDPYYSARPFNLFGTDKNQQIASISSIARKGASGSFSGDFTNQWTDNLYLVLTGTNVAGFTHEGFNFFPLSTNPPTIVLPPNGYITNTLCTGVYFGGNQ